MRKVLMVSMLMIGLILAVTACWGVIRFALIQISYQAELPVWLLALIWGWV